MAKLKLWYGANAVNAVSAMYFEERDQNGIK